MIPTDWVSILLLLLSFRNELKSD